MMVSARGFQMSAILFGVCRSYLGTWAHMQGVGTWMATTV